MLSLSKIKWFQVLRSDLFISLLLVEMLCIVCAQGSNCQGHLQGSENTGLVNPNYYNLLGYIHLEWAFSTAQIALCLFQVSSLWQVIMNLRISTYLLADKHQ